MQRWQRDRELAFLKRRICQLEQQVSQDPHCEWGDGRRDSGLSSTSSDSGGQPQWPHSRKHAPACVGSDPSREDCSGWCDTASALCAYAAKGDVEAVRRMLQQPWLSVNDTDYDGRTPLHAAARNCQLAVAELLVSMRADVNATDCCGCTPLALAHAAPDSEQKQRLVVLLRSHGGNLRHVAGEPRRGQPMPMGQRRGVDAPRSWGDSHSPQHHGSFESSPDFSASTPLLGLDNVSLAGLTDAADLGLILQQRNIETSHQATICEPQPVPKDSDVWDVPPGLSSGASGPPASSSGDDQSGLHGHRDEDHVIEVPEVNVKEVTFDDPNTGNTLRFQVMDKHMFYSINDVPRSSFQSMTFSPAPPRVSFPCIGTCATLPRDANELPRILGGLRCLAERAGVEHDIAPTMRICVDTTHWISDRSGLIIVMVGLPGRGKTFISKRLCRWLNWKGITAKIFNVGNYRRKVTHQADKQNEAYFDPHNRKFAAEREKLAEMACADVQRFIQRSPGGVAIYDATNSSRSRRQKLVREFAEVLPRDRVIFIESVCTMEDVIESNILKAKAGNGDYRGRDASYVLADFKARIRQYEKVYEPLCDEEGSEDAELSWVQLTNICSAQRGGKVIINKVTGHLAHKLVYFLLNMSPYSTSMYLAATGECAYNTQDRVGGNSPLTERGWRFAAALRRFFNLGHRGSENLQVWTSTERRGMDTCTWFTRDVQAASRFRVKQYKTLDDINYGDCDGHSIDQIKRSYPKMWLRRQFDKYNYGWPRGESAHNLNVRLEQVILDMHKAEDPVLVVADRDVCRGLYAYLAELLPEICVHLDISRNCLFEFTYYNHDVRVTAHDLSQWVEQCEFVPGSMPPMPREEGYLTGVPDGPPPTLTPPHEVLPSHVTDAVCMNYSPVAPQPQQGTAPPQLRQQSLCDKQAAHFGVSPLSCSRQVRTTQRASAGA